MQNPGQFRTRHGHSRSSAKGYPSKTYQAWAAMKSRCINVNVPCYAQYGGRGITVCERWLSNFEAFLADMGEARTGMSIDRIDNNGNYEPSNCRWATRHEQQRNTRQTRLTVDLVQEIHGRCEHGESQRSVARRMGISQRTVSDARSGKTWADQYTGAMCQDS